MAVPRDVLLQLQDNLNILNERNAKYGGNAPLELLNQIEDHQRAIKLTQQFRAGELSEAEWREALRPLLVTVRDVQPVQYEPGILDAEVEAQKSVPDEEHLIGDPNQNQPERLQAVPANRRSTSPFKTKFRSYLERANYSQADLARSLGLSPSAVSKKVNGHILWLDEELEQLSSLLKLSPTEAKELFTLAGSDNDIQTEAKPPGTDSQESEHPDVGGQLEQRLDITIRALSDAPTTNDLLGFTDYAEALIKFIEDPQTEKPLTIAIDAPWGMGKSSLMRMIEQRLAGQELGQTTSQKGWDKQHSLFPTVWFNAWQYDQSEAIWANLVLEILAQAGQRLTPLERLMMKLKLDSKRFDLASLLQNIIQTLLLYALIVGVLGLVVTIAALLFLDSTLAGVWQTTQEYIGLVGLGAFIAGIVAIGREAYQKLSQPLNLKLEEYFKRPDYQQKAGFLPQFQADFKRVVEVVTQKGRWPLIIFIDDLDRCEPPKPVEIVEAINLLLDSKYCVFIIGMDTRTVASSIEAKYKDMLQFLDNAGGSTLSFGAQFLEKIIQIRFRIPQTTPQKFERFINKHLVGADQDASETDKTKQQVAQAAAQIKAEQREQPKSVEQAAAAVQQKDGAAFSPQIIAAASRQVAADEALFDKNPKVKETIISAATYFGFNPRQVKRFINLYRLQTYIAQRRGLLGTTEFHLDLLGKWLILSISWPQVVAVLRRDRAFMWRLQEAAEIKWGLNSKDMSDPDFEDIKARLTRYLEDKLIAGSIDDDHLRNLLNEIKDAKHIQQYLDLTEVSLSPMIDVASQLDQLTIKYPAY